MNRDQIIRMAVECQLVTTGNREGVYMDALERYATLVAADAKAKERQRIVNLLMIQHDAAQERHHYWLAAAKLVQADVGVEE